MGIFSFIGDTIGSVLSARSSENAKDASVAMSSADREMQERFAKEGVRWRVADARAAGLHPLAALGAQISSPSPTAVGITPDTSMGDYARRTGQSLDRAMDATRTANERSDAQLRELQIERARLENRLLEGQITTVHRANNPAFPGSPSFIEGQGDSGRVVVQPSKVITGSSANAKRQPGHITEYQLTAPRSDGRGSTIVPSEQMKERIEDDFIAEALWHLKNRFIAPRHPDQDQYWNPFSQSYERNPIPRKFRFIR